MVFSQGYFLDCFRNYIKNSSEDEFFAVKALKQIFDAHLRSLLFSKIKLSSMPLEVELFQQKKENLVKNLTLNQINPLQESPNTFKNQKLHHAYASPNFVINNHFVGTFNPKRTSVDINSFVQIFRKKVRHSEISKQFDNSLQKFTQAKKYQRKGFKGNSKKVAQEMIQVNSNDSQLQKFIISDLEYSLRNREGRHSFSVNEPRRLHTSTDISNKKSNNSKTKYRFNTTSGCETEYLDSSSMAGHNASKTYYGKYRVKNKSQTNPSYASCLVNEESVEGVDQSTKPKSLSKQLLFTNGKLNYLSNSTYQKPNLMYNLSLYRKKYPNLKKIETSSLALERRGLFAAEKLKQSQEQEEQSHAQMLEQQYESRKIEMEKKRSKRVLTSGKSTEKLIANLDRTT